MAKRAVIYLHVLNNINCSVKRMNQVAVAMVTCYWLGQEDLAISYI